MSCLKILVLFVIAQCCGHRILLHKEVDLKNEGKFLKFLASIRGKWIPFGEAAEAAAAIQKRELVSGPELPTVEEKPPAPTVELIEGDKKPEPPPAFYGFLPPEHKVILARSPVLNTNTQDLQIELKPVPIPLHTHIIGEMYGGLPPAEPVPAELIPKENVISSPPKVPMPLHPHFIDEFYDGLPPPKPVPAEPIPKEETVPPPTKVLIPIQPHILGELYGGLPLVQMVPVEPVSKEEPAKAPEETEPPPSEATSPALFDKTKVRKYAVYAGDVILKYLSQFFNRARVTFNRFTSPPPPEPEFKN